jgi:methyl-accepting chemotaxis protein
MCRSCIYWHLINIKPRFGGVFSFLARRKIMTDTIQEMTSTVSGVAEAVKTVADVAAVVPHTAEVTQVAEQVATAAQVATQVAATVQQAAEQVQAEAAPLHGFLEKLKEMIAHVEAHLHL